MGWNCRQELPWWCSKGSTNRKIELRRRSWSNGYSTYHMWTCGCRSHVRIGVGLLLPIPSVEVWSLYDYQIFPSIVYAIWLLYLQFSKFKLTQFQANIDRLCWYILLHDDGSDNIHNVQGKGDICRCCRKRPCRFRSRLFVGSFVQHEKVSVCYLVKNWRLFHSYRKIL